VMHYTNRLIDSDITLYSPIFAYDTNVFLQSFTFNW